MNLFSWWHGQISLGEFTLAVTTAGSAWYVGSALKRKQDRDIAIRELIRFFCRESLGLVAKVSEVIRVEFSRTSGGFDEVGRNNVVVALQRLSNSIHAVDLVVSKAEPLPGHPERDRSLHELKNAHEALSRIVLDPLVSERVLDKAHLRQIEGAILKVRENLISLEVETISKLA
ncbi:MAG: hypothetical protein KGN84_07050 [Acidobacteriota bacterium]|nr:hypothetical protein [Acidobacteriota bacterium]